MTTDHAARRPDNATLIVVGYVFAIFMPLVGLVIGLTQFRRGGLGVVLAAVLAFVFWLAVILAAGWAMAEPAR